MTATTVAGDRGRTRAGRGTLWRAGLAASGVAALVNGAVFALAVAAGLFPSLTFTADAGAQMSIEPVLLVSVVATLTGVGAFALLRRMVAKPVPVFLWIAAGVLLISFAAPFAIPGTAPAQAVVLNLLHLVVAAVAVGVVLRNGSVTSPV